MKTPTLYTPKTRVGRLAEDMVRRYYAHDVARDSAALTYYLLFALFAAILQIPYRLSLIIQYVLTVNISIFSMRYYVFRSGGNLKDEYFRAWGVYLLTLGFNYAALFLLIDAAGLNAVISQGIYIVVSTIVIFLLHKNYSFRN